MDRSAIRDPVMDSRRRDARKDMLRRLEIPSVKQSVWGNDANPRATYLTM